MPAVLFAALLGAAGGCADVFAAEDRFERWGHRATADHDDHHDESKSHEHAVPTLTKVSEATGLAAPESVYFDAASRSWYVSNMGEMGKSGDGFIAKLDQKGALVQRELITGLDDPKGVRVHKGILWVTDQTQIVRVDLKKPTEVKRFPVPDAVFLNDLTIDTARGDVYVSDTFLNAIFKVQGETVSQVLRSPALEGPNGLIVQGHSLLIATLGPDLNPTTFETSAPGRVLRLDLKSKEITQVTEPLGFLDGLEVLGKGFLVSDYWIGTFYVDAHGTPTKVQDNVTDGLGSAADIGLAAAQGVVGVPDHQGTKVVFYKLGTH